MSTAVTRPTPHSGQREAPALRDRSDSDENPALPFAKLVRLRLERQSAGADAATPGSPSPASDVSRVAVTDAQLGPEGGPLSASMSALPATPLPDQTLTPATRLASADPFLARGVFGRQMAIPEAMENALPARPEAADITASTMATAAILTDPAGSADAPTDAIHLPMTFAMSDSSAAAATHSTAPIPRRSDVGGRPAPADSAVAASENPASAPIEDGERQDETMRGPVTARLPRVLDDLASRNQASSIFVALHAMDEGIRVIARVGRMDVKERVRLRHAVSALLAEFGAADAGLALTAYDAPPMPRRTGDPA